MFPALSVLSYRTALIRNCGDLPLTFCVDRSSDPASAETVSVVPSCGLIPPGCHQILTLRTTPAEDSPKEGFSIHLQLNAAKYIKVLYSVASTGTNAVVLAAWFLLVPPMHTSVCTSVRNWQLSVWRKSQVSHWKEVAAYISSQRRWAHRRGAPITSETSVGCLYGWLALSKHVSVHCLLSGLIPESWIPSTATLRDCPLWQIPMEHSRARPGAYLCGTRRWRTASQWELSERTKEPHMRLETEWLKNKSGMIFVIFHGVLALQVQTWSFSPLTEKTYRFRPVLTFWSVQPPGCKRSELRLEVEGVGSKGSIEVGLLMCLCCLMCGFIRNVYQWRGKVQLNSFLPRQGRHFWMLGRFWSEAIDQWTFLWLTKAPVRSPFVSLYNRDFWTTTLLMTPSRRQVVLSFCNLLDGWF